MKHLLFTLFLAPLLLNAQDFKGRIVYEETIQFKFDFGGEMEDDLIAKLPTNKKDYSELLFTPTQSLYRATEAPEGDKSNNKPMSFTSEDGANIEIVTKKSSNATHHDIEANQLTQKIDFMSRTFLIQDDLSSLAWKLDGDTKEILGYQCSKATYTKDSTLHEAWYTTELPLAIGPASFVGLPGAILELSIDNGHRNYTATKIELDKDFSNEITPPKKGKKVTKAEFEKIKEEKLKEMELEYGTPQGTGGAKIFIQKN